MSGKVKMGDATAKQGPGTPASVLEVVCKLLAQKSVKLSRFMAAQEVSR